MITPTNLREEIQQQISIGFTRKEIEQNLLPKGYMQLEIKEALDKINFSEAVAGSSGGTLSTKSILLGIVFIIIAAIRLARYTSGGNIFIGLGVITGIGMAIHFFTRRK